MAVNLQLSGYPGWFRSDFGWGYPLVATGHVRTVVKLPLDWAAQTVTGVRVVVEPPSAARSDSAFTAHRAVYRDGSGPGGHSGRRCSARSIDVGTASSGPA